MMPTFLLWPIGILLGVAVVLRVVEVIFLEPWVEPETIQVRPTLQGKALKEWTELYKAVSVQRQGVYHLTEYGISEYAWDRYEKVTGREQWVEVPNPDYVEVVEQA
jgi:hypothetical protein